jgi:hypothetical protein
MDAFFLKERNKTLETTRPVAPRHSEKKLKKGPGSLLLLFSCECGP